MKTKLNIPLLSLVLVTAFSQVTMGLIFTGEDEPVNDHGWPVGSVVLANLPTRVSWWAGPPFGTGSMYEFQYGCNDTKSFNEALELFASINASKLELVVHNGPKPGNSPTGDTGTDWTFTVWNPEDWDRLNNTHVNNTFELMRSEVPAPRIDVYVHDEGIHFDDIKVPAKIIITDTRPVSIDEIYAGAGLVDLLIIDMSNGKGIEGAQITLQNYIKEDATHIEATTDNDGKCRISKIPEGNYQIIVKAAGYVPRKESYQNQTPTYEKFHLPLSRPSQIKGIFRDTDGNPIPDAKIVSRDFIAINGQPYPCLDEFETVTDSEGVFELKGLPTGFCQIRCRDQKWHMTDSIFQWYPVPGDEIKLTANGTATVQGKIVTAEGTAPEGTINLSIEPAEGDPIGRWGYGGYVPQDGVFKIEGIPPDTYTITAKPNPSPGKYQADERILTIESGQIYDFQIVLRSR